MLCIVLVEILCLQWSNKSRAALISPLSASLVAFTNDSAISHRSICTLISGTKVPGIGFSSAVEQCTSTVLVVVKGRHWVTLKYSKTHVRTGSRFSSINLGDNNVALIGMHLSSSLYMCDRYKIIMLHCKIKSKSKLTNRYLEWWL